MIPILNLTRQYQQLQTRINEAVLRVLASGNYILGPNVQAFEQEMAQFFAGADWVASERALPGVVGCANGSDALYLALLALDIGPGDEVITTPFTYIATSEAIQRAGATPVFVDIDPDTYNLDPTRVERAISPRTKALLPVHLFGLPTHMAPLLEIAETHHLAIIEDCAQAIGALYQGQPVGTLGDIGCFSFFPSKNLGAFGDGGMCVSRRPELVEKLRMLRVHGSRKRYVHELSGINSRLDELQAAILREKLPYLDAWNQARRTLAQQYHQMLAPLAPMLQRPLFAEQAALADSSPSQTASSPAFLPVFHQYTLCLTDAGLRSVGSRDTLVEALREAQVQAMVYYPIPGYRQPSHAALGVNAQQFPNTENCSERVFSLPMFPELTVDEQRTVVAALTQILQPTAPRVQSLV
jgi:dTDP-4-amino-4,6-dideoxygalactose transaminase